MRRELPNSADEVGAVRIRVKGTLSPSRRAEEGRNKQLPLPGRR